jgi:hypothetical protein
MFGLQILILENGKDIFVIFFTNPIVKKSKADTKAKKLYDRFQMCGLSHANVARKKNGD